jgi:hypothetical protein
MFPYFPIPSPTFLKWIGIGVTASVIAMAVWIGVEVCCDY